MGAKITLPEKFKIEQNRHLSGSAEQGFFVNFETIAMKQA